MDLLEAWRVWRLYGKVKTMDKKALFKILAIALGAAAATASTQYVASDSVNYSAVISATLTAIFAFIQKSPTQ